MCPCFCIYLTHGFFLLHVYILGNSAFCICLLCGYGVGMVTHTCIDRPEQGVGYLSSVAVCLSTVRRCITELKLALFLALLANLVDLRP